MWEKKEITSFESHTNNSLRPGRRAERSIMTNTANFVKLSNGIVINVDRIDGIFPNRVDGIFLDRSSGHKGYTIQLNGKDFQVDENDAQVILNVIGMNTNTSFNPDKRIAAAPVDNFPKMFSKIKAAVDNFNANRSLTRLTTDVDRNKKTIKIKRSEYSCLIIEDGIITEDDLTSDIYNELKTAINSILIEG
jgi:hypothetical protein